MKINHEEKTILLNALSCFIENLEDYIEDFTKTYDGDLQSAKNNIIYFEDYLSISQQLFNKIDKEVIKDE